jgi:hypothetical protein
MMIPAEILNRIGTPEITFDELVFLDAAEVLAQAGSQIRLELPIPDLNEFAITLKVDVDKVSDTRSLCVHIEVEDELEEQRHELSKSVND